MIQISREEGVLVVRRNKNGRTGRVLGYVIEIICKGEKTEIIYNRIYEDNSIKVKIITNDYIIR